jgi:hypothetical protein
MDSSVKVWAVLCSLFYAKVGIAPRASECGKKVAADRKGLVKMPRKDCDLTAGPALPDCVGPSSFSQDLRAIHSRILND